MIRLKRYRWSTQSIIKQEFITRIRSLLNISALLTKHLFTKQQLSSTRPISLTTLNRSGLIRLYGNYNIRKTLLRYISSIRKSTRGQKMRRIMNRLLLSGLCIKSVVIRIYRRQAKKALTFIVCLLVNIELASVKGLNPNSSALLKISLLKLNNILLTYQLISKVLSTSIQSFIAQQQTSFLYRR